MTGSRAGDFALVSKCRTDGSGWDGMIANVDAGCYARSEAEGIANATLIAAAPDMFYALRETLLFIEAVETVSPALEARLRLIRAALDKAQGAGIANGVTARSEQ